jgi:predicted metal-dependent hydrolase
MGASDPAERDLYQGLIKLAAAFVHDARGNPAGVTKNLRGARDLLEAGAPAAAASGLDIGAVLRELDGALARDRPLPIALARFPR